MNPMLYVGRTCDAGVGVGECGMSVCEIAERVTRYGKRMCDSDRVNVLRQGRQW